MISYKYSSMLLMVYMAMLYGMLVPIIIPITLIALINLHITDHLLLAYICKQPPVYDERLTKRAIKLLAISPIGLLMFGFWALENPQFFANKPEKFKFTHNESPSPQHYLFGDIGFNPSTFMLILLIDQLLRVILGRTCLSAINRIWPTEYKFDLFLPQTDSVNMYMGNFFNCLSERQKESWLANELYNRHELSIKMLPDESLKQLRKNRTNNRRLEGDINYEILSNTIY